MRRIVMVACAALMFIPVIMKSRTGQDSSGRAAFRVLSSGRVTIKIDGDVLHPGIYEVAANYLAASVINMAKPLRPLKQCRTDAASARPLRNGYTVRLELLADGTEQLTVAGMTVPERMVLGIPLDISTMDEADFDRLPGIGPALARRMIEFRQKNGGILRVEDLSSIEGIGEKKYRMIRAYFQQP